MPDFAKSQIEGILFYDRILFDSEKIFSGLFKFFTMPIDMCFKHQFVIFRFESFRMPIIQFLAKNYYRDLYELPNLLIDCDDLFDKSKLNILYEIKHHSKTSDICSGFNLIFLKPILLIEESYIMRFSMRLFGQPRGTTLTGFISKILVIDGFCRIFETTLL